MHDQEKPIETKSSKSRMATGLIVEEKPIPSINEEFNQYSAYSLELIRAKSIGNVLIVEDDPLCAMFIEHVAREFSPKLKCFRAVSELEALSILKFVNFDLVISDHFIEGSKTGLDLCQKIHDIYPRIKCLIVSSMEFEKFQKISYESEIQPEFMKKPLSSAIIKKYLTTFFQ